MAYNRNKLIMDDIIHLNQLRIAARQTKAEMDAAEQRYIQISEPSSPNNPDRIPGGHGDVEHAKTAALSEYHDLKAECKHLNFRINKACEKKKDWMRQCPEEEKDFLWELMSGSSYVHVGEMYGYSKAQDHLDRLLKRFK
jgi:hypothetical protein